MMNKAIRKRLLMSHECFAPKRWEGKNLSFRFKYLAANYPELLLSSVLSFIVAPLIYAYKMKTYEGSELDALQKYRAHYTVVRHDDPDVERLLKQKEIGREHYPQ